MIRNKPYIIAELGVNWRHEREADKLISSIATKTGVDAVKFQCFQKEQNEKWFRRSVNLKQILRFKDMIHGMLLELLCTPMYPEAVKMLRPHVDRWKIRAADVDNHELIDRMLADEKTIIQSVPHDMTVTDLGVALGNNEYFLHCVTNYPAEPKEINYDVMEKADGFSCHCPDMSIWDDVKATEPEVVEVHVTPDKEAGLDELPDNDVSYSIEEVQQISEILKDG